MPLTLSDEQIKILKNALMYMLISHRAYFDNKILFGAMKDSGDFEKVVANPLREMLNWTNEDDAEKERVRTALLEGAKAGKTPEEWYKSAKQALQKEFKITGRDVVIGTGVATAGLAALFLGGKVIKAITRKGKDKKKTGE